MGEDAAANFDMVDADSFSVKNMTKGTLPRVPFARMKDAVLGARYELSLVFVGERRAQALNMAHRKKEYAPNVLSFPLEHGAGEIFICPSVARREAQKRGEHYQTYLAYLFIHALFHLEGLSHGATMERKEQELLRRFGMARE